MKNSINNKLEGQKRRGKIFDEDLNPYLNLSSKELITMLKDKEARKRTIAAKILGFKNDPNIIGSLIEQFSV